MAHRRFMLDDDSVAAGEFWTAISQLDTSLPDQYLDDRRASQLEPEKRLMLAVLQDAVVCYQRNLRARESKKRALFREVDAWLTGHGEDAFFSFENVCEALGLNPCYVLKGLRRHAVPPRSGGGPRSRAGLGGKGPSQSEPSR